MTLKRMHILPVAQEEIDPPEVQALDERAFKGYIHQPYTQTFANTPPTWTMKAPDPRNDPRNPDFNRATPDSAVITHDADVDIALDASLRYAELVDAMAGSEDAVTAAADVPGFSQAKIILGEVDIAKKIMDQKGRRTDAFIGRLGTTRDIIVPGEWKDVCLRLLRAIRAARDSKPEYLDVIKQQLNPHETNAGWPTGARGWVAKFIGALCTGPTNNWDTTLDISRRMAFRLRIPEATVISFMIAYRSGPTAKFQPDWQHLGRGKFVASTGIRGAWPRARHVFMGPFAGNLLLEDLWANLLAGIKRLPGLSHAGAEDDELAAEMYARRHYIYESDISAYDQSVTRAVQQALRECLLKVFPELKDGIDAWFELEGRAVLTPSWLTVPTYTASDRSKPRGFTIVGSEGGTHSGSKMTSVAGTLICLTTTIFALRHQRGAGDPMAEWLKGERMLLCLGDDILLSNRNVLDRDAWESSWDSLGFKTTLLPGCRFLMQHRTPDGPLQVGARVIQNSMFPEYYHEGKHAPAMNALAFAARTERGVLEILQEPVFQAVSSAEWIRKSGARSWDDLQYFSSVTALPAVEAALSSVKFRKSLSTYRRDADFSPSARRLVDMITAIAPDVFADDFSLDLALARASTMGRKLPEPEKLHLASQLFPLLKQQGLDQHGQFLQAINILTRYNSDFEKVFQNVTRERYSEPQLL
jgi:hypothetical protein